MLVNLSTQESKMALNTDKQGNLTTKATLNSTTNDLNISKDLNIYDFYQ